MSKSTGKYQFGLEELEPRILLSANFLAVAAIGSELRGDGPHEAAVHQASIQPDSFHHSQTPAAYCPSHQTHDIFAGLDHGNSLSENLSSGGYVRSDPGGATSAPAESGRHASNGAVVQNTAPVAPSSARSESPQESVSNTLTCVQKANGFETLSAPATAPKISSNQPENPGAYGHSGATPAVQKLIQTLRAANPPPSSQHTSLSPIISSSATASSQSAQPLSSATTSSTQLNVGGSTDVTYYTSKTSTGTGSPNTGMVAPLGVTDLMTEINNDLNSKLAASDTVTNVTLGGFIHFDSVTVGFSNVSYVGPATGTVSITGTSGTLAFGPLTGSIASITGSYDIATNTYSISLTKLSLSLASFVKVQVATATLVFNPNPQPVSPYQRLRCRR